MIYFIAATKTRAVKIGTSIDPWKRMASLQTASHEELLLLGTAIGSEQEEAKLHKKYARDHLRGEWFQLSKDLAIDLLLVCKTPEASRFLFPLINELDPRFIEDCLIPAMDRTVPNWRTLGKRDGEDLP